MKALRSEQVTATKSLYRSRSRLPCPKHPGRLPAGQDIGHIAIGMQPTQAILGYQTSEDARQAS